MSSDQRGVIHVGRAIGPDISSLRRGGAEKKKKRKKRTRRNPEAKGWKGGGIDHAIIGNATIGAAAPINPDASSPRSITEFRRRVWK